MLRRIALVVVIGSSVLACGSASEQVDNTSTFTGHWVGDNALDMAPVLVQPGEGSSIAIGVSPLPLDITTTEPNAVAISGVCGAFNGMANDVVVMDVTGPSTLTGRRHACSSDSSAGPGCATPNSIVIEGGSGTYASGGLAVALTGTYTWCGNTIAFTYRFSGVEG